MTWKKTWAFFAWQSFRFAESVAHFKQIWANYNRWCSSFDEGRNSMTDELPWLNFFALDFLESNIGQEFRVFEFGGGGSTLFFCKNVAFVATVEDNEQWFNALLEAVRLRKYRNWEGFWVPPVVFAGHERQRSCSNPDDFKSSVKGLENMSFEAYARTIDQYPTAYFDLILVDGRARPSCIKQAIPHLKKGGLLVIDNTERPHYLNHFQKVIQKKFEILENRVGPVAYTPDFTCTTILRKQ